MQTCLKTPLRQQASEEGSLQGWALEAAGARVEVGGTTGSDRVSWCSRGQGRLRGLVNDAGDSSGGGESPRPRLRPSADVRNTNWELERGPGSVSLLEEELDPATREVFAAQAEIRSLKGRPSQRKATGRSRAAPALTHEYRRRGAGGRWAEDARRGASSARPQRCSGAAAAGRSWRGWRGAGTPRPAAARFRAARRSCRRPGGVRRGRRGAALCAGVCRRVGGSLAQVGRQSRDLGGQQQVLATNLRLVIEQAEALRRAAPTSLTWRAGSSGGRCQALPTVEQVDKVETAMGESPSSEAVDLFSWWMLRQRCRRCPTGRPRPTWCCGRSTPSSRTEPGLVGLESGERCVRSSWP